MISYKIDKKSDTEYFPKFLLYFSYQHYFPPFFSIFLSVFHAPTQLFAPSQSHLYIIAQIHTPTQLCIISPS